MSLEMEMVDPPTEFDNKNQPVPASISVLAKNILTALSKAYPKWDGSWRVEIDTRGGIIQITNVAFSGEMGFVMHITQIDPEMRLVVRNAGELFERFNIARKRAVDIRDALNSLPVLFDGSAPHEV
jgi:hypothetical protein